MREKTLDTLLKEGKAYLKGHNISQSALDAELLFMQVLDITRIELFTKSKMKISETKQKEYIRLLEQRAQGIPLQYLKGTQEFMGLSFLVTPAVLIPRPDTEILVESVLEYGENQEFQNIAEVGTGSGCISISLAYYHPKLKIVAGDISIETLKVAIKNSVRHQVQNQIQWIQSDIFGSFPNSMKGKFDAIISNPPYIPTEDIPTLMKEVKDHEPYHALNGGKDGLDFYRRIIQEGNEFLKSGGYFFFEIGKGQEVQVGNLLKNENYEMVEVRKDLSGINRVVIGSKRK